MSSERDRPEEQPASDQSPDQSPGDAPVDLPPGRLDDHQPDGLDLARAAARAAAALPGAPARRKRSPGAAARRRTRSSSSGAHPDDRDPQLLGNAMDRLVAHQGWEVDLKVQGVFGRWSELVGDEVADHCTPESFDDGRLVVRTDSTAWATQLKLLAPSVVRRLNEDLGHGTVRVIEVLGPHLPTWKKGRFGTRDGRGPRDTYG